MLTGWRGVSRSSRVAVIQVRLVRDVGLGLIGRAERIRLMERIHIESGMNERVTASGWLRVERDYLLRGCEFIGRLGHVLIT